MTTFELFNSLKLLGKVTVGYKASFFPSFIFLLRLRKSQQWVYSSWEEQNTIHWSFLMPWWLDIPDTSSQKHANDDKRKLCLGRKGNIQIMDTLRTSSLDQGQYTWYNIPSTETCFLPYQFARAADTNWYKLWILWTFEFFCLVEASPLLCLHLHDICHACSSVPQISLLEEHSFILE